MKFNQLRREILSQHGRLRELLEELETLVERFEQGDEEVGAVLRERGLHLYQELASHVDEEDHLLAPALCAAGAHGKRLAERLAHEHREQRELLKYLVARLTDHPLPTVLVARELQNFAEYLRLDMALEEESMLTDAALSGADKPA